MYKNINIKHLEGLFQREPEAQLVVDTLIENHKRIMGTLSHEIRNPLTLLYGNLQLLQQRLPGITTEPLWLSALEDFQYTHDLLNELSLYNNANSLNMVPTDTSEFFRKLAFSFSSGLIDTDAEFTAAIPELPSTVIDQTKIKSVILNLLKNAKEATSSNDTISMILHSNAKTLEIKIIDSGVGIPLDQQDTVFEPFVTHKSGGTGLGLAICKDIIQAHDGEITLCSTEGIGTQFKVLLPLW